MEEEKSGWGTFQNSLQLAINNTYSYNNQSNLFCALVPSHLKDYAQKYVLPCCQWVDGYVPALHGDGSGIVSTRIATSLVSGMAKQVVGEKPIFKNKGTNPCHVGDSAVAICDKIAKEGEFRKAMYGAVAFAMTTGTSLIKLNSTAYGKPWWEAVRLDNCYFTTDFRGCVQEASFFIRNYADTRATGDGQRASYYLIEKRFYETEKEGKIEELPDGTLRVVRKVGEKIPMVAYKVFRSSGQTLNKTDGPINADLSASVPWAEMPKFLRNAIRNDYGAIRLDEPRPLPFLNLGVEVCRDGEIDISVPTAQCFGKSKIIDVQSDLINYEIANAYRLRDAYLGKGTLYLPKSMSMGDLVGANPMVRPNVYGGLPDSPVELMKGMDAESQQAIVKQFELRTTEWQKMIDDSLKAIATKWGTTPKALSSYLSQGEAQQTATQIDSEDDMSIAFIQQERSYFVDPFNRLLDTTLNFLGVEANAVLTFGNPSLVNKDRLLARVEKEYEMGLIDLEEAVREVNPDLDEVSLRAKIDKAMKRQAEFGGIMDESAMQKEADKGNQLEDGPNLDSIFNDNEDDNGGNNLRGSTFPTQKQGKPEIFN